MFPLPPSPCWEDILHSHRCAAGTAVYLGAGSWVAAIHPALAGHCTGIWGLPQEKSHISYVIKLSHPWLPLGELNPSLQLNKEQIQK